ncbi:MAG: helix-turn-helix domain-containing protein [Pseudomonadota bacterium]
MIALSQISCGDCPIRHRAVCSRCDVDELALLDRIKTYQSFRAGETILWAEEPMDFVASVVIGAATLSKTLEDGRRQMVGLLLPSDFIGRPHRPTSPLDVTAVADTMLCRFNRRDFETLIAEHPHISERLLDITMDELDAARDWMVILGRKTAREKIASFLTILAQRQAALAEHTATSVKFTLPITREAMADYLGLTIETVSRQLTALRKAGLIEMQSLRGVLVPDLAALEAEAGDGTA